MPTYEYKCNECNTKFELNKRKVEFTCCGEKPRRVWAVGGVVFKGSGFHKTDYK